MPLQGVTQRDFADLDGCSHTAVQTGVNQGRLKVFADGSLDPKLAGTPWRAGNRRKLKGGKLPRKALQVASLQAAEGGKLPAGETPAQAAERIVMTGGATMDQAEAERVKENYIALLRKLDYDLKSGAVVPSADVLRLVGAEYAKVRTRLLAIPAEQAPALHRLKTVPEVQDLLRAVITEALKELTQDDGGGASAAPAVEPDLAKADDFIRRVLAGEYASQGEADQIKANALALKHVLAARKAAGETMEIADAERVLFERAREVRDAWMNWPARVGPLLAAELGIDADRLVNVLSEHVHRQLADLGQPEPTFSQTDAA